MRSLGIGLQCLIVVFAVLFLAWPGASHGQEPVGKIQITLDQAVEKALKNSRQLDSLDTNVEIRSNRLRSAGHIDNPELRLSEISSTYLDEEYDELEIGLRWRPPGLGGLGEDKQRAKVDLWEERVDAFRMRTQLAARVRKAYSSVVMYQQLLTSSSARVENESHRIAQIEVMKDLGRRSIVYYTKSQMLVTEAKAKYTQYMQRLNEARRRLQKLTGVNDEIEVTDQVPPTIDLSLDQLLEVAYANRPEVRLVEERKTLAEKQYLMERLKPVPWFTYIELSHHIEDNRDDWQELMLGIELPLFNWNLGNIKATNLGISRKETQSQAIYERIEDEVRETYSIYSDALLDWNLSDKDGQEMMAGARKIIEEANLHKTVPADEVLELERAIMDVQDILAQKRGTLDYAVADLCYALGVESPLQLKENTKSDGS